MAAESESLRPDWLLGQRFGVPVWILPESSQPYLNAKADMQRTIRLTCVKVNLSQGHSTADQTNDIRSTDKEQQLASPGLAIFGGFIL